MKFLHEKDFYFSYHQGCQNYWMLVVPKGFFKCGSNKYLCYKFGNKAHVKKATQTACGFGRC